MSKEKVLIVGGGFAGVKTALELASDNRFEITLLSKETNFKYYPTLYHVATGGNRANANIPLSSFFQHRNINLKQGEALNLDRQAKTITTKDNEIYPYDTLVLSLGVVTNYFHIPGLEELSYGVKNIEDVEKLKSHLHQQLISYHKPD
jgi:NADH dehydrogenase